MATLNDLVKATREYIDESAAGIWQDTDIKRWINDAYRDISSKSRLLQASLSVALVQSTGSYSLSATTLKNQQHNIERVSMTMGGSVYTLARMDRHQYDDAIRGTQQTGIPGAYLVFNNTLYLDILPSTSGTLSVWFINTNPTNLSALTDSPDLPVEFHRLIPMYAAAKCKEKDEEMDQSRFYLEQYEEGIVAIKRELRAGEDRNYVPYVHDSVGWQGLGGYGGD